MVHKHFFKVAFTASTALVLSACGGGGGSSSNNPNTNTNTNPDYSKLEYAKLEPKELKFATSNELETHIKNGFRIQIRDNNVVSESVASDGSAVPEAAQGSSNDSVSTEPSRYSTTNTHVAGVDEADYVKYDGEYMYVSSWPDYLVEDGKYQSNIAVYKTEPATATYEHLSTIQTPDQTPSRPDLLLVNNQEGATTALASISNDWSWISHAGEAVVGADVFLGGIAQNTIELNVYNAEDPSNLNHTWKAQIDGSIRDSRKVGNILYLVTNYYPYIDDVIYFDGESAATAVNEKRINETPVEDLIPGVSINGGEKQPLFDPTDCLVPVDNNQNYGYSSIVTIMAIDLANPDITSAICLNTHVDGIYASLDSVYLGGSSWENWGDSNSYTTVHKFDLNGTTINYRSTGVVPGALGWSNPSFFMDEYNDTFRIVTTTRDPDWTPNHSLHVLRDAVDSDSMELVSVLPNEEKPQAIGKPNEDIYAVRFAEERAYIVTFERIDPLYVIDLSNAESPSIAGELEIPGFSTYLHPIGDDYLLGIGQEVDLSGSWGGIKTSLFNIEDMSNPVEINNVIIGDRGVYSDAGENLHALSFMQSSDDQLRLAFSASVRNQFGRWHDTSLHLLEVNGLAESNASLNHVGKIIGEEASIDVLWPTTFSDHRSVLHDSAVYFVYGEEIIADFWPEVSAN